MKHTPKHTPGPWTVNHNNWEVSTIYAGGRPVAKCLIDSDADEDNEAHFSEIKDADAMLIAASPDLLYALKLCAAVCAGQSLEAAKAAIKKATGETP